jgi:hypothetical protein
MDPRGFPTSLPEFQRVFPDDAVPSERDRTRAELLAAGMPRTWTLSTRLSRLGWHARVTSPLGHTTLEASGQTERRALAELQVRFALWARRRA